MPADTGRRFGSKYLLGPLLGRGAMGAVYRSTDLSDDREVAIKLLHPHLVHDSKVVDRFLRERTVLNKISHPSVVDVYDMVVEGDELGIVMELVDGDDLRHLLKTSSIEEAEVVRISAAIADGLVAVHQNDVVHRDLKPANVLLDRSNGKVVPKISDFGVARLVGSSGAQPTSAVGTPSYMAPETLEDEAGGARSPADVYALGIMMYEMLTGELPFTGETALAVMMAHLSKPAPRIDGIAPELADLIEAMLAKNPASRPSALACRSQLTAMASGDNNGYPKTELRNSRPGSGVALGSGPRSVLTDTTWVGDEVGFGNSNIDRDKPEPVGFVETSPWDDHADQSGRSSASIGRSQTEGRISPTSKADSSDGNRNRDRKRSARSTRGPWITIAAFTLVLIGAVVAAVAMGRNQPDGSPVIEYAFAPVFLQDDVSVQRTWTVDDDGTTINAVLSIENTSGSTYDGTWVEVIPKELATDVSDIRFVPEPDTIIETDPIVAFAITGLGHDEIWSATYSADTGTEITTVEELTTLAQYQIQAQRSYLEKTRTPLSETTLSSIRVISSEVVYAVGETVDLAIQGQLSNGEQADDSTLDAAVIASSNAAVVEVVDGKATAVGAGEVLVTATIGELSSSVALTVVEPPGTPAEDEDPENEDDGPEEPEAPGPPIDVVVDVVDDTIVVSWQPPTGTVPVESYTVTLEPGGQTRSTKQTKTVWTVEPGTYTFTVKAINEAGSGPTASSQSVEVNPAPAPSCAISGPSTIVVVDGQGQAQYQSDCTDWVVSGLGASISQTGLVTITAEPGTDRPQTITIAVGQGPQATAITPTVSWQTTATPCTIDGPTTATMVAGETQSLTYTSDCASWSLAGGGPEYSIASNGVLTASPTVASEPVVLTISVGSGDRLATRTLTITVTPGPVEPPCTLVGPTSIVVSSGESVSKQFSSDCTGWSVTGSPLFTVGPTGLLSASEVTESVALTLRVGEGDRLTTRTIAVEVVDTEPNAGPEKPGIPTS